MNVLSSQPHIDIDYRKAEEAFTHLLRHDDLDRYISDTPERVESFEHLLGLAMFDAYKEDTDSPGVHLFLQRILYQINRLKLFWYDDLRNYANENSAFLFAVRNKIDFAWQKWEARATDITLLKHVDVETALRERAAEDLDPEPSPANLFFRNDA